MKKVLVAYASKHHATAEIAQAIGDTLRQSDGLSVDVLSVETVKDIAAYDAVVLGSAVYVGQWQGKAADFLKEHERELTLRPVWLFSSGPTGDGDPAAILKGWTFPEALKPIADRIKPRDIALFHGKLDLAELSFVEKLPVKAIKAPLGDFRNWDQIRAWATGIAQAL